MLKYKIIDLSFSRQKMNFCFLYFDTLIATSDALECCSLDIESVVILACFRALDNNPLKVKHAEDRGQFRVSAYFLFLPLVKRTIFAFY